MSYDPRKAAQTIAYFAIKNSKRPLDVLKAIKLVYLADRASIERFGFPIQDERRVSMPHGPVNSETYSYIQGERDGRVVGWEDFLRDREDHKVALARREIDVDDLDELSAADLEVLDDVWSEFGKMSQWEIRDWTHNPKNVPEWEDPDGSSTNIPLGRLLQMLNVENALEQAEKIYSFDQLDEKFRSFGS